MGILAISCGLAEKTLLLETFLHQYACNVAGTVFQLLDETSIGPTRVQRQSHCEASSPTWERLRNAYLLLGSSRCTQGKLNVDHGLGGSARSSNGNSHDQPLIT